MKPTHRISKRIVLVAVSLLFHTLTQAQIYGTNHKFAFVGNDNGWQERLEQLPGVRFLNGAGQVQEAFQAMGNIGLNAVRVTVNLGQPLTSSPLNTADPFGDASHYLLNYGGVDQQVDIARRAKSAGMKVIVTIDLGYYIPGPNHDFNDRSYDHWQTDTYSQMLTDIQQETTRLLDPFLQAGIQPDIFVASDETDGGILGHAYDGNGDRSFGNPQYCVSLTGNANCDNVQTLAGSDIATGDSTVYPKFVGFIKAEFQAAKNEIAAYFPHSTSNTFYSLHSMGRAPGWYYSRIFSTTASQSETVASWKGQNVPVPAVGVPTDSLATMVDVLGSSYYFNTPTDGSDAAFATAFDSPGNHQDLTSLMSSLEDWGLADNLSSDDSTYVGGTYQGKPAKKFLVLETSVGTSPSNIAVPVEQSFINYCFQRMAAASNRNLVLGMMWWEGEYTEYNGTNSLYTVVANTHDHELSPIAVTWGQYAQLNPNLSYSLNNTSTAAYMTGGQYPGSWNTLNALTPATAQTFHAVYNAADDTYTFVNDREGAFLGVWNDSDSVGAHVELTPPAAPPKPHQEWSFVSNGLGSNQLINVATGLAVDNQGFPVQSVPSSSPTQQWSFQPIQRVNLVSVANGQVLDSNLNNLYGGQYTALEQLVNNTVVSQQWTVVSDYNANLSPDTYYRIADSHIVNTNGNQPFLLAPWPGESDCPICVEQTSLDQANGIGANQEWALTAVMVNGQTAYQIVNRSRGLALDAPDGPGVLSTPNSSVQSQLWYLVPSR